MDSLRDALKGAGLQSRRVDDAETPPKAPDFAEEGLYETDWVRLLGRFTQVPKDRGASHLEHLLHTTVKALKAQGNKRDARSLGDLHASWRKKVDKQTWAAAKARARELELSDKTWRAIKQALTDPAKVLAKLNTRRAEEYRGASPKRVLEWLS